jgi:hypothetical protein
MTEHPGIAEITRHLDRLDGARLIGRGVAAFTLWGRAVNTVMEAQCHLTPLQRLIEWSAESAEAAADDPERDPVRYPPTRDVLRAWAAAIARSNARLEDIRRSEHRRV